MAPRIRKAHQVEGSDIGALRKRLCFWMEMRTGKTLTAIDSVKKSESWPLLVVCPKGLFGVWESEFKLDGADMDEVQVIKGSVAVKKRMISNPKAINIVNYDILEPYDILNRYPWGSVIFDESIKLANMTAKVTLYCLDWAQFEGKKAEAVFMLSGSPASEGPFQLISQLFICTGEICGYKDWQKYLYSEWRYDRYQYKWKPKTRAVTKTLQKYSEDHAYIKTAEDVGASFNVFQRKVYVPASRWMEKRIRHLYDSNTYIPFDDPSAVLYHTPLTRGQHEQQICAGMEPETKKIMDNTTYHAIRDYVVDLGQPVFIYSALRRTVIDHMAETLRAKGIKVGIVVGGPENVKSSEKALADFKAGRIDVIIGQQMKIKMGHDLSRASSIIALTNSFSNDDRIQVTARCSNLEKTADSELLDFVHEELFDDNIVDVLEKKESVSSKYMEVRFG